MKKPFIFGIIASMGLLAAYFIILSFANSPAHAFVQFAEIWYFMIPLVAGFGIQIGLFVFIREVAKISAVSAAVSGSVSGGSMMACCAHHIADVLPIIGFSALAAVFNIYQPFLLSLGIFSNIIGILFMLRMMQKHNLHMNYKVFEKIMKYNMKTLMEMAFVVGIAFLMALFISI